MLFIASFAKEPEVDFCYTALGKDFKIIKIKEFTYSIVLLDTGKKKDI